jgi:hypothetical protein
MTTSASGIARVLRRRLVQAGRRELATDAVDRVRLTDDGTTIYIHIFMRPSWPRFRQGDAYPLAFADHPELATLAQWRAFHEEGRLLLEDDFDRIVRWLDGR